MLRTLPALTLKPKASLLRKGRLFYCPGEQALTSTIESLEVQPPGAWDWRDAAECAAVLLVTGVDYWYGPEAGEPDYVFGGTFPAWRSRKARQVCAVCTVRVQCLSYAMANGEEEGIWAGMMPEQRRQLGKALAQYGPEERAERIREVATSPVHIPRAQVRYPKKEGLAGAFARHVQIFRVHVQIFRVYACK